MRVFLALPASLDPAVRRAIEETLPPKHTAMPPLPDAHTGIAQSERNRFLVAIDQMMEADLLIAEASAPDAAVGWCLAWFLARGRLAIVCCRRDARAALSAMVAGNPSPWQRLILYDTPADLQVALRGLLA